MEASTSRPITRRSQVQILPPLLERPRKAGPFVFSQDARDRTFRVTLTSDEFVGPPDSGRLIRAGSIPAISTLRISRAGSADAVDDLDEFVGAVALSARELDEILRLRDHRAVLWCAGDGNAAAATEFEEAFLAEFAECAQHGVGVDAKHGGKVLGGRQSFARFCLSFADRPADLGRDLNVQREGLVAVELDIPHDAIHCSVIQAEGVALTVTVPPSTADTDQDRDLPERVAALEALIEEARRRARRRRRLYAAAALGAIGFGLAIAFGIGGGGRPSLGRPAASGGSRAFAPQSSAGRGVPHGPEGGDVFALAIDRANPEIVYAGGWGNVFKSTNAGGSWRDVTDKPWTRVTAVAIDPTNPKVVYAGTDRGVAKTADGGRHWRMVNTGLFGGDKLPPRSPSGAESVVGSLIIDAQHPATVYATTGLGLDRTTNGGARWQIIGPTSLRKPICHCVVGRLYYSGISFAIDPNHAQTIYASRTSGANGLRGPSDFYVSSDGGDKWRRITISPAHSFSFLVLTASGALLGADQARPGVFRSSDGGRTWSPSGLPQETIGALTADPGSGAIYATTSNGAAVFQTTDGADSWQTAPANLAWGRTVTDPSHPATMYATTADGLDKSVDHGQTWAAANKGLVSTLIRSLVLAPGSSKTLYAGAGPGLFKSSDGGHTWRLETVPGTSYASALAVSPQSPGTIYVGTGGSGLFKSTDAGRNWTPANTGLTANTGLAAGYVEAVAVDPRDSGTAFAVASTDIAWGTGHGGAIFRTTDGGTSWRPIKGPKNVQTLAVTPKTGSAVFAGTNRGLYRSRDGGARWQLVATGHTRYSHLTYPDEFDAIVIDPHNLKNIYAGISDGGILKSTDGGDTWAASNTGLTDKQITTLAVNPRNPQTLYVGTGAGVYRSTDGAHSWHRFDRGLTANGVAVFAIDPAGRTIYAGTQGDGVVAIAVRR
ncbi:MAG: hypothetical protein WAQ33_06835 [Gaiellaceae bacterium]